MGAGAVVGWRRRRLSLGHWFLIGSAALTVLGWFVLTLRSVEPSAHIKETTHLGVLQPEEEEEEKAAATAKIVNNDTNNKRGCATVENMGEMFGRRLGEESLRARQIIHNHFNLNGAPTVRALPPEQFCKHGFVLGKASEAGFGNEMYKILTAAALSVMLNRSLIIGQTRGKYPFGDYIVYSNLSFTLMEVKHLWRMNGCVAKYGRHLVMRIDDFQKPARTNVLCHNWRKWHQPIIWFQNTTDAVAAQFFLKNMHLEMRKAASDLFGEPDNLQHRPNVFGELMRVLISPSENVEHAVSWALGGGGDPDIAMHMRMLMNRSVRAVRAALNCIRKAAGKLASRPKVVLVSDTPSLLKDIGPNLVEFAEVIHFDYEHFEGNITAKKNRFKNLKFRMRDWGPAPRWVAFVDFFLASRAKHAVISGAHRRVGTTYAQLIAALAAAHRLVKVPETIEPRLKCSVSLDSSHSASCIPTFSYRELAAATNNFRRECLIGEGGFGSVYKGKIESTGQDVAIKKLDPSGFQGSKEFLVEVLMLSLLHHPNLIDLVGFCAEGEQRLLVYELLPLGSLEDHLHDLKPDMQPLDWNKRMKIAAGIAEGLDYLHNQANPPVIHRDLKSSNILLGEGFHPKLSDFGLAKFGPTSDKTHVSTRIMGTQGYCAPEYYGTGKLTMKSDIYCFGIVLLEIITGRRALDAKHGKQTLLEWARPLLKDHKNPGRLADQQLKGQFSDSALCRAIEVALMCLNNNPLSRPSMTEVACALKYLTTQRCAAHVTRDGKCKNGRVSREEGKHVDTTDFEGAKDASPESRTFTLNKDQERARAVAEAKLWGETWRAKMQLCGQSEFDESNL